MAPTSDLSTTKRVVHTRLKPRVHIVVAHGADYEARRVVAIPKADGDMSKTFEAAVRTVPTLLNDIQFAVVIYGEEVIKYPANVFKWLCGIGPDPAQQDPNWMGHAQEGVSGPNDVDIEHG